MRLKRIVSAVLLTALFCTCLSGCGGNIITDTAEKLSPFYGYKIVRPLFAYSYVVSTEVDKLAAALEEKYGVTAEIITDDKEAESDKEIILSGTSREGVRETDGLETYSIRTVGKTVYLEGGTDRALMVAVTEFIKLIGDGFKVKDGFLQTGDYENTVAGYGDDYFKRTWGDDFSEGNIYDREKWTLRYMSSVKDIKQEMTDRTCRTEDGLLYLTSFSATAEDLEKDPVHGYYSPAFLQTQSKMEYLYGCFEIKSVIDFTSFNSVCFGFQSSHKTDRGCNGSIDLVELLGSTGAVIANVHCWGDNHTSLDGKVGVIKRSHYIEGSMEEKRSHFHTYYLNWTPEYMDFGVDAEPFFRLDITAEGECKQFNMPTETDIAAYHLPMYPIIAEFLYSPARGLVYGLTGAEDPFRYETKIDHVDIYQQKTVGEIYFGKDVFTKKTPKW